MAYFIYASFKGNLQGHIAAPVKGGRGHKWIPVLAFQPSLSTPIEASGGRLTMPRTHAPIGIVVEHAAAASMFLKAHLSNEMFSEIVIERVDTSPSGPERVVQRITLTNATISTFNTYAPAALPRGNSELPRSHPLTQYWFVYHSIRSTG